MGYSHVGGLSIAWERRLVQGHGIVQRDAAMGMRGDLMLPVGWVGGRGWGWYSVHVQDVVVLVGVRRWGVLQRHVGCYVAYRWQRKLRVFCLGMVLLCHCYM